MLCAGREAEMPPELLVYPARDDGRPGARGWGVRVVPHKFPTLRVEGDLERRGHGLYDLMNGVGAHEVIIESPRHDESLAALPVAALEDVLQAYQQRILDLRRDPRLRSAVVFKSAGPTGGAPPDHSHSQLLATPTVAPDLSLEMQHARSYFEYRERCLFCDILQQEIDEGLRIVVESDLVVALVPFAARTPFETWLLPRRHLASYEHVSAADRRDLARVFKTVLHRMQVLLAGAPVAFVLHSAPFGEADAPYFHWHIEITPSVATPTFRSGGSGFPVNLLPPEDAARFLCEAAG